MANREDYYGGMQQPKSRRSPPQLFQTGQGGRTILPPLASVIPTLPSPVTAYQGQNAYTQPRATQPRNDFIPPSHEGWNTHEGFNLSVTQPVGSQSYPLYPTTRAYSPQSSFNYQAQPTTSDPYQQPLRRTSPSDPYWNNDWHHSTSESPTDTMQPSVAGYPSYATYPSQQQPGALAYPPAQDRRYQGAPLAATTSQMNAAYAEARISTPRPDGYPQASSSRMTGRPGPYPTVQAVAVAAVDPAMSSAEQNLVKKKRKRADAAQLKVLNEVYARTAFPSTEERAELARKLDMSPRSVQIWFQNKRQAARQTSRQASITSGSGQEQSYQNVVAHSHAVGPDMSSPSSAYTESSRASSSSAYGGRSSPDRPRSVGPSAHSQAGSSAAYGRPQGADPAADARNRWHGRY